MTTLRYIFFILLFLLTIYTTLFLNRTPLKGNDFDIYIHATKDALRNIPIYEKNYFGAPFSYPPSLFTFILPFVLLPYSFASVVWKILSIALFVLTVRLIIKPIYKVSLPTLLFIATIFIISPPFFATIEMGQINLVVLFFTILSFFLSERKLYFWSGVVLGIAASLKIIPLFLLIYFLSRKEYKVVFISGIVFIALNFIVYMWGISPLYVIKYIQFIHTLTIPSNSSPVYNLMVANSDQSLTAYLIRYFALPVRLQTILVFLVTLFISIICYLQWRNKTLKKVKTAHIELFCWLLAIATLFPTTLAWNHHLVFLFPLLILFLTQVFIHKTIKSFIIFIISYTLIAMDQSIPQLLLGTLGINPQIQLLLFHSLYGFFVLLIFEIIQLHRLSFDKFSKVWFTSIL